MKTISTSIQVAVLAAALTCGAGLRADSIVTVRPSPVDFRADFRSSHEAKMLRDAYIILATGDHDYNGHREGAMQQVKAAADLLSLDLRGDGLGGKPQVLSNERLREAKDLIVHVLDAAALKDQRRIVKHLNEAVHQINVALGIK
jgi:hypothetical protein